MLLDHPLDGTARLEYRKKAYAVDYYLTSAFVHCSLPAIDNYFIEDGVPFHLSASLVITKRTSQRFLSFSFTFMRLWDTSSTASIQIDGLVWIRYSKENVEKDETFSNTTQEGLIEGGKPTATREHCA